MDHAMHQPSRNSRRPPLAGLALDDENHRMVVLEGPAIATDREQRFSFQILRNDGEPEREYDEVHEKRMHLIVIRRDLTGFQHVHPELEHGTWHIDLETPLGGSWRAFADFSSHGVQKTLGVDLHVEGSYEPKPIAAPRDVAHLGDHVLRREMDGSTVTLVPERDGQPVQVEPYLGGRSTYRDVHLRSVLAHSGIARVPLDDHVADMPALLGVTKQRCHELSYAYRAGLKDPRRSGSPVVAGVVPRLERRLRSRGHTSGTWFCRPSPRCRRRGTGDRPSGASRAR